MNNLLPLFALVLAAPVCQAQSAAAYDDRPKISVNGEAVVKVRPDRIVVTFGVETSDGKIDAAREKNGDVTRRAMAVFEACGVPRKDVQTDCLSIEPRYRNEHRHEEFLGYFVRNTLVVTLDDAARVEELIAKALEAGVNYLHGVDFQTTELRKHRDAARDLALKAAREKAERMAGALGQTLGTPILISEGHGGFSWWGSYSGWGYGRSSAMTQNTMQSVDSGAAGDSGETLALGQISVRANVSVTFLLRSPGSP